MWKENRAGIFIDFTVCEFWVFAFYRSHFAFLYRISAPVCEKYKKILVGPHLNAGRRYRVIFGS